MGRPGPFAYRGRHGHHPRPASGSAVPPRPVVAVGLASGPLPDREHPGPARRAASWWPRASCTRRSGLLPLLFLVVVFLAAPGPHRDRSGTGCAPRPGWRSRSSRPSSPLDQGRAHQLRPLAGHLAPARLPPAGRPAAGGRRARRLRAVAGGLWCTPCCTPTPGLPPQSLLARGQSSPPPGYIPHRLSIPVGRVPDRGRDRAAGCGAAAHRRGRGARRRGRAGAAWPQPGRGTGTPGGTPDPDPDRRRRRGRRRTAAPGAGPARRHPAAAGRAGHAAGHGPGRTRRRDRRRTRSSPRPTRTPRRRWPNSAT